MTKKSLDFDDYSFSIRHLLKMRKQEEKRALGRWFSSLAKTIEAEARMLALDIAIEKLKEEQYKPAILTEFDYNFIPNGY